MIRDDPRYGGALGALAVWTVAILAAAAPMPLPAPIKAAAALVAMLLVPGWSLASQWPEMPGGWASRLGLAAPLSLCGLLIPVAGGWLMDAPILPVAAGHLFLTFLLLVRGLEHGTGSDRSPSTGRAAWFVVLAAVAVAAWSGAARSPITDGPDHIATVNEIVLEGHLIPTQGLTADGEVDRADPRKGIFHIMLAAAAVISGTEARDVWQAAPPVLAGSWVSLILVMGSWLGRRPAAGWLSALIAFGFLGGTAGAWSSRAGYGAHVGLFMAWGMTWVWLAFRRASSRVLLAWLGAAATAVHPMAAAFFVAPAAACVLMAPRGERRSGWAALIASVAGALPVLVYRWIESRGPLNPIHLQPMPVLEIAGGWDVLWPGEVVRILGVGVLAIPSLLLLQRAAPMTRRFLAAAAILPLIVALTPGVFGLATAVASSLPVKFLYAVPFAWILGIALASGWTRRGFLPRAALAAVLLLSTPSAAHRFDRANRDVGRSATANAVIDILRAIPGRIVVAADPWLSGLIAAETPHFPVTVLHQHGHPLDARGLDRLNDLGRMLSPWESPRESLERMLLYRISHVAVAEQAGLETAFGCVRGGEMDRARLAKFSPGDGPFTARGPGLIRVDHAHLAAASTRPQVEPRTWEDGEGGWAVPVGDGRAADIVLSRVRMPRVLRSGESIPIQFGWSRVGEDAGWPVIAHVRLTSAERRPAPKWRRWLLGERAGRLRQGFRPFRAAWPGPGWPAGDVLVDSQVLQDYVGLAPGRYRVSVRVLGEPVFLRVSLHDLVSDEDRWQGNELGVVTVVP